MIGADYKQVVTVGEHVLKLPSCPKSKSDVLFVDQKDPIWNREEAIRDYRDIWHDFLPNFTKLNQQATLYDQDGLLISLNKEDSDYIIRTYEREWHRRTYGVHVKIGNEIIWLTGDHWFILAWCKTKRPDKKGDYFDYREFQAWLMYLIWYVNKSENITGAAISKAKKTGITNLMWLYFLNKATMTKNINLGHMNIDQNKGSKTFREHFIYAYNSLTMPLKPDITSRDFPKGQITFGKQFNNSKKSRLIKNESENELGTSVMCVPTMVNAFDIDVFSDTWYDEYPKPEQDFGEIYRSNAEGTALQDINIGKKWLTSYTPEGESPSFMSARQIFFDSELRTIRPESNGQTKSRLICWHIPAFQSWTSSFNKYGKCNEKDAMEKIVARRNLLKDKPRDLLAETRRYANTKNEAWSIGGVGSVFDNTRLGEIVTDIEENERNSAVTPYWEGKLEWTNELWEIGLKNKRPKGHFCPVKKVPLSDHERMNGEEGKMRIYYDVPPRYQNMALKQGRDEWGNLLPPSIFIHVGGADPTSHAAASEVIEGSKNAYWIKNRTDERIDTVNREISTNVFMIEYYDRPELPDEAYEDLVKLIIYTGALMTVEANVPEFATRLIAEGLGMYMIVKDDDGIPTTWKRHLGMAHEPDKKYHLIRTTANNQESRERLEMFVRMYKNYMQRVQPGEKDYGKTIKSARWVNQCMNLNVADTKKSDLFMAGGYAFYTDEIYSGLLMQNNQDENVENVQAILEAFTV